MRTVRNHVNGTSGDALSGATTDLVDPATGKVFGTAPLSGADDVDAAYRAAVDARPGWSGATPAERQRALLRFADRIEAHTDDLVTAESQNTGKLLALTRTEELAVLVDQLRFFAAPPVCSRASRPASTWPATRRGSGANRSVSSAK